MAYVPYRPNRVHWRTVVDGLCSLQTKTCSLEDCCWWSMFLTDQTVFTGGLLLMAYVSYRPNRVHWRTVVDGLCSLQIKPCSLEDCCWWPMFLTDQNMFTGGLLLMAYVPYRPNRIHWRTVVDGLCSLQTKACSLEDCCWWFMFLRDQNVKVSKLVSSMYSIQHYECCIWFLNSFL
jgi:hypothetical protein